MGGKARPRWGTDRYVVVEWLRSSWRIRVGQRVLFDGSGRIRWRNSYGNDPARRPG